MIILKITQLGQTIEIPGLPTFRSPVDIDITNLDMRKVAMYLKASSIEQYKIVSKPGTGNRKTYTNKDFEKRYSQQEDLSKLSVDKRFDKLEKMMASLLIKKDGNVDSEKEQITDKLDNLEKLFRKGQFQLVNKPLPTEILFKGDEPEIEELDSFIPEINLSDMTIKSDIKIIKRDDDIEDSVDILSSLMKK